MKKWMCVYTEYQDNWTLGKIYEEDVYGFLTNEKGIRNTRDSITFTTRFQEIKEDLENPIVPKHYNSTKISTFDIVNDWGLDFYLGNAVKYIQRAGKKDPSKKVEDLKKAVEYLNTEIKNIGGK